MGATRITGTGQSYVLVLRWEAVPVSCKGAKLISFLLILSFLMASFPKAHDSTDKIWEGMFGLSRAFRLFVPEGISTLNYHFNQPYKALSC